MPGRLEPEPIPRRDFLGLAGLWSAIIAIGGSIIGMARLPKPSVLPEASSRFRLGDPEEFPPGTEKIIPGQNVYVISTNQGIAAISMVCTHLGCIVAKVEGGFACPCHGSKFSGEGKVKGGPAPRPLRWIEVSRAADGTLMADHDREVALGTFYSV
jgi:cytochrome b6-f complex iron-sulfur subunit